MKHRKSSPHKHANNNTRATQKDLYENTAHNHTPRQKHAENNQRSIITNLSDKKQT